MNFSRAFGCRQLDSLKCSSNSEYKNDEFHCIFFSDSIDFNDHRIIDPKIIHAKHKRAIDNTLEKVSGFLFEKVLIFLIRNEISIIFFLISFTFLCKKFHCINIYFWRTHAFYLNHNSSWLMYVELFVNQGHPLNIHA